MMEEYISVLNNYIAENKPRAACPNVESLLDMLFCCYSQHKNLDTATVKMCFSQLDDILQNLTLQQTDEIVDLTCALCDEHQKNAFREGVTVGFRLYQELCKTTDRPQA